MINSSIFWLKSMDYSDDIKRRLRVIEGALGINIDTSGDCSGDPNDCSADPCDEERCPMRNNLVQRMYKDYQSLRNEILLFELLFEELERVGIVTDKIKHRARLLMEQRGIILQIDEVDSALENSKGAELIVEMMRNKKKNLQRRFSQLESEIEEFA